MTVEQDRISRSWNLNQAINVFTQDDFWLQPGPRSWPQLTHKKLALIYMCLNSHEN